MFIVKLSALVLICLLSLYRCFDDIETYKERLKADLLSHKLENYMRRMKLKNSVKEMIFLEERDLKSIKSLDINEKGHKLNYEEFKVRLFALLSNQGYKPLGLNSDEEKIDGWKTYIVLLNAKNESKNEIDKLKVNLNLKSNHKLVKVCLRQDTTDNFAFVLNFDEKCKTRVDKINETFKEADYKSTTSKLSKLHSMQERILSDKIKMKLNNYNNNKNLKNAQNSNNVGSFIEKSSTTYKLETLAQKFSVEELGKIKALIKFAKNNKIIEEIYSLGGDVSIESLVKKNFNFFNNTETSTNKNKSLSDNGDRSDSGNGVSELRVLISKQAELIETMMKELKSIKEEVIKVKVLSNDTINRINKINTINRIDAIQSQSSKKGIKTSSGPSMRMKEVSKAHIKKLAKTASKLDTIQNNSNSNLVINHDKNSNNNTSDTSNKNASDLNKPFIDTNPNNNSSKTNIQQPIPISPFLSNTEIVGSMEDDDLLTDDRSIFTKTTKDIDNSMIDDFIDP